MSEKTLVKAAADLLYDLRTNMTSVTRYVRHKKEEHPELTARQFIDRNREYKALAEKAVHNIFDCVNQLDKLLRRAIDIPCVDGTMKERLVEILMSKPYGHSTYDEMAEYLLSKRVLALPCKIDDEIYVIPSKVNYELNKANGLAENNRVYRQKVEEILIRKDGTYMLYTCGRLFAVHSKFFGHTWFLDREKAEEELKKRGQDK